MSEKVKVVKFSNGDEVVAEVQIDNEHKGVRMKNAIRLVPNGNQIVPVPFSLYAEPKQEFFVSVSNVLAVLEPAPEVIEHYKKVFSPIITPPSNIQLFDK